jgi:subtilase family serine protease
VSPVFGVHAPCPDSVSCNTIDGRALMVAHHEALAEAAAQGTSVIAASGDAGAYELNRDLSPYFVPTSTVLSAIYPGADRL